MYEHLVGMYVCVPHVCLVPLEAKRRCWMPWNWSHLLGAGNRAKVLLEQQVLLAISPAPAFLECSVYLSSFYIYICYLTVP